MSDVSLCNRALDKVGGSAIVSLEDDSTSADVCRRHYADTVEELLSMHPWSFAKAIRSLNRLPDVEAGEYGYAYQLPSDTLTVWGFVDDPEELISWEVIEDNILLADVDSAKVWISKKVSNAAKFTPLFTSAFVPLLGSRIAYKVSDSATKETAAFNEFLKMLDLAASADSQQGNARGRVERSSFLDARENYS